MFISYFKSIDIFSVYCVRIDLFTLIWNTTAGHNFNVIYFLSAILEHLFINIFSLNIFIFARLRNNFWQLILITRVRFLESITSGAIWGNMVVTRVGFEPTKIRGSTLSTTSSLPLSTCLTCYRTRVVIKVSQMKDPDFRPLSFLTRLIWIGVRTCNTDINYW